MRVCVTCSHIDRDVIEQGIVTGVSISELSRRFGISEDSLFHHRDTCLPQRMANAETATDLFDTDRILERILWLHTQTVELYNRNKGVNDGLALKALGRLEAQSQTAIRVKEYILKKEKASGNQGADIAAILSAARKRLTNSGIQVPEDDSA